MGSKRYCKADAETILLRQEKVVLHRRRGVAISAASVISVLDGLAGMVVGFLLMVLGILGPTGANSYIVASMVGPFLDYFQKVLLYPAWQAIFVGFFLMVLGAVDMIAGFYLWRRSKAAAVVSVAVASIAGGTIGGYLLILALVGGFLYIYLASVLIKLAAIGYGWRHLNHPPVVPTSPQAASTQAKMSL